MTTDTGGNAYPETVTFTSENCPALPRAYGCEGMTLLDYFAGQVIVSLAALPQYQAVDDCILAHASYSLAAAMVAEKRRRETT